jgi:hypothetical protein
MQKSMNQARFIWQSAKRHEKLTLILDAFAMGER